MIMIILHRICCKGYAEVDVEHLEDPHKLQKDSKKKSEIFFLCLGNNNKIHLMNEQVISWLGSLGHHVIQLADPVVQEEVAVNPEDWFFDILNNPKTKFVVVENEVRVPSDSLDSFKLFYVGQITTRLAHNYNRLAVIQYLQLQPARLLLSIVAHTRLVLQLLWQDLRFW